MFLTDLFKPLVELGEEIAGKRYGDDQQVDVALRVLADHARAMSFLIADGVLPSNEGRGYVLAPRHPPRRPLQPFGRHAAAFPAAVRRRGPSTSWGDTYPELVDRREAILRTVVSEEERFNRTLDQGLVLVEEAIARAHEDGSTVFPGAVAFQLHDTYGSRWRSPVRSSRSGV